MNFLIIILLAFLTVFLLILGVAQMAKDKKIERRMKGDLDEAGESSSRGLTGMVKSLIVKIGKAVRNSKIPIFANLREDVQKKLVQADRTDSFKGHTFIGLQVVIGIFTAFFVMFTLSSYNALTFITVFAVGFFVSYYWLIQEVKKRHKAIFRQLPDVLDILTLSVEAGLDFGAALNRLIKNEEGPLIDEFIIAENEVKLGKSRMQALVDMAKRVNYPQLNSVINTLNQSITMGASIGPTLKTLSDQFRIERGQMAEKLGAQAPVKMLGPLLLLIFPTIFIILFGPIVLMLLTGRLF